MTRDNIRSAVALTIALSAPLWQHVGTISRSMFPAPESATGKDA
jgi:hypothetical protein